MSMPFQSYNYVKTWNKAHKSDIVGSRKYLYYTNAHLFKRSQQIVRFKRRLNRCNTN